jgi:hypothetical protein
LNYTSELNNLRKILRPLNLYSLTGNTLVETELSAYAYGLSILNEEIKILEREAFVRTAIDFGLLLRERLTSQTKEYLSFEARRNMLNFRTAITSNDYTRKCIENDLIACGLNASIVEYLDGENIYLNCFGFIDEFTSEESAKKRAKEFLPSHLNVIFDFRTITWNSIDSTDTNFNYRDSLNFTWNEIDNYK